MLSANRTGRSKSGKTRLRVEVLEDRTVPAYVAASTPFENLDLIPGDPGVVSILQNTDDDAVALNIGANTFNFYGTTYTGTDLFASSNGLITFGVGEFQFTNEPLDSTFPQPGLAPLWDDLITTGTNAQILYTISGNRLIVEWNEVEQISNTGTPESPLTFQAILQLNTGTTLGSITFNYVDLDTGNPTYDDGASATIGIKADGTDNTGDRAITLSFNSATYSSGQAVRFDSVPPTARAGGPYTVDEGGTVTLNARGSTGAISTYEWDLDYDGVTFDVNSTALNPTFSAAGIAGPATRTVALRVTDDTGVVSPIDTATVSITDVPPRIAISGASNVVEGSVYTLALGAVSDPGRTVSSYVVHWGDGGTNVYSTNGAKTHTYADGSNAYSVTVDLVDEDGPHANAANAFGVSVTNAVPTIAVTGGSFPEGSTAAITLGAVTDPGTDRVSSYVVHWGDGVTNTYSTNGVKTHAYVGPGTYAVTVDLVDEDGAFANRGGTTVRVVPTPVPPVLPRVIFTAVGVGTDLVVYNGDGSTRFALKPFAGYGGNITVAAGDITGDGIDDIVVGAESQEAHVKVYNGATGAEIASFYAYRDFAGGVSVAVGDVLGLGHAQVITGAGPGGGPHVKVFDVGAAGAVEARSFFAYDAGFHGGVSVSAGRLDSRGHDLLVTGAGVGGGPHVKVFDVARAAPGELRSFYAYDTGFQGGVNVAAGDGYIATGAGSGGKAHVELFRYADGEKVGSFLAYPRYDGSVRVALSERSGTLTLETGSGPDAAPRLNVYRLSDLSLMDTITIGNVAFNGGVYVA